MSKHITRIGYTKGMIENIKQDIFGQAHNSVLWLQNYINNIEHGTLVKRKALVPFSFNNYTYIADKANPQGLSYTSILNDTNNLLHSTCLKTANPLYNDTYVLFFKRASDIADWYDNSHGYSPDSDDENTGILAYCYYWDGNEWVKGWREPFHDQAEFPGWFPVGTLQDVSRYGESLVFTTRLLKRDSEDTSAYDNRFKKLKDWMYPCYMWKRWDISKKRDADNQYWNGLDLDILTATDKKIYSNLKVYTPNQSYLRELTSAYSIRRLGSEILDLEGNVVNPNDIADISLFFHQKPMVEEYEIPQFSNFFVWPKPYIITSEVVDNPTTIDEVISDCSGWTTVSGTVLVETLTQSYSLYKPEIFTLGDKYGKVRKMLKVGECGCGSYFAMCSILPDYLESATPRPWFNGERIPFVITLVINGVEIIAKEGVYVVHDGTTLKVEESKVLDTDSAIMIKDITNARSNIGAQKYQRVEVTTPRQHDEVPEMLLRGLNIGNQSSEAYRWTSTSFALRVTDDAFKTLIESNCTSIKLYVSKPSDEHGLLRSVGVLSLIEPPPILYKKSAIDDSVGPKDYSQYALVKEFKIDGNGDYLQSEEFVDSKRATNAWTKFTDIMTQEEAYWAAVQEYGDLYPEPKERTSITLGHIAPDFYLWDYPTASEPLNLQSSGRYWKGTGARLIAVVKTRTFLAGTIDDKNIEEQAIVRFSAVQSGVASPDVFNEEDTINVGHLPHTALMEFREQLLVFNRTTHYRIMMPNVFDYSTWEFLETIDGAGTFSQKTIINTPHGYAYCNDNGVWLSEGNIPESLTDNPNKGLSITQLYKHLATGNNYPYASLINPGSVPFDTDEDYNKNMEFNYDSETDELVLSTPIDIAHSTYTKQTGELRLVFSFAYGTWRVEYYDITHAVGDEYTVCTSNKIHRLKYDKNGLVSTYFFLTDDGGNSSVKADFLKHSTTALQDSIRFFNFNYAFDIEGILITHEIGDNENDFSLDRLILEAVPFETIPLGFNSQSKNLLNINETLTDTHLYMELRNRKYAGETAYNPPSQTNDLIYRNLYDSAGNLIKGRTNIFGSYLQTPGGSGDITNGLVVGDYTNITLSNEQHGTSSFVGRESLILRSPFGMNFRSMRLIWKSIVTAKIGDMEVVANIHRRRSY
jgi:hypothetical protein